MVRESHRQTPKEEAMAWIDKRTTKTGEIRYLVGWREAGTGKRVHETFHRFEDARRRRTEIERQHDAGEYVAKADRKKEFGQYATEVLESEHSLGKHRDSTAYASGLTLKNHIAPELGTRPIGEIKTDELRRFFGKLDKDGVGPSAKEAVYKLLAKVFHQAVKDGLLPKSPLVAISRPQAKAREVVPPTPQGVLALAEAADPRYRVPILVAGFAGLRGGELGGLRIQDVDFDRQRITVKQAVARGAGGRAVIGELKTKASRRTLPIGSLVEEIRAHVDEFPVAPDGRIFSTNGHQGKLTSINFNRAVQAAAKKLGIGPVNAHSLRHTCASFLIEGHASVKQVQKFLGHTSASMTLDTYADLWPDGLDEVATTITRVRASIAAGPVLELPGVTS
jgi:integrase